MFGKLLNRTMLTVPRLVSLEEQVKKFQNDPSVCMVQCGVAKGGALALISDNANPNSTIYGFDSFSHMPTLCEEDENEIRALNYNFDRNSDGSYIGKIFAKQEDVLLTFEKANVSMENVILIEGYVQDTLPKYIDQIDNIAVLHLDMDFYEATKYALEMLYDKVIDGGYIVLDDYNAYIGCMKAVNEFRKERNITDEINEIIEPITGLPKGAAAWWEKSTHENKDVQK